MPTRRNLLLSGAASLVIGALAPAQAQGPGDAAPIFPYTLSDAEWRARLTPAQFAILRRRETERGFTSRLRGERSLLLHESRPGTYNCAGCGQGIYRSEAKFDSRSGWPSFHSAIDGATGTTQDTRLFRTRTSVHCANCGGHLGQVFQDGPPPTGLRHRVNGLAMTFTPDETGVPEGFPGPV